MAFSDFKKISEVQKRFRIKYTTSDFFDVETDKSSRAISSRTSVHHAKYQRFFRLNHHVVKPLSFQF